MSGAVRGPEITDEEFDIFLAALEEGATCEEAVQSIRRTTGQSFSRFARRDPGRKLRYEHALKRSLELRKRKLRRLRQNNHLLRREIHAIELLRRDPTIHPLDALAMVVWPPERFTKESA